MTVRTPLYWTGSDLREMDSTMIANIQSRAVYLYGDDPSVDISQVSSGGNISPSMNDTRLQAGATTLGANPPGISGGFGPGTFTTADDFSFSIPGVSTVTVTYDRISQTVESISQPTDTNSKRNFVYQSGGDIVAMSNTDMYDTFYNTALTTIADGNDRPGTYRIATSTSVSNMTLMSSTPVFQDTRANAGAYTSPGETQDQPTTITNYYLHRVNQSIMSNPSVTYPIVIDSNNDLQLQGDTTLNAILKADIRYWGRQFIRYTVNGTGNNRGTGMSDTKLNSSTRSNRQDGSTGLPSTTYRSQQFPSGTATTISTNFLRIHRNG